MIAKEIQIHIYIRRTTYIFNVYNYTQQSTVTYTVFFLLLFYFYYYLFRDKYIVLYRVDDSSKKGVFGKKKINIYMYILIKNCETCLFYIKMLDIML